MTKTRTALALVLFATAASAQAQTYGQPPLYRYAAQPQPYAVEVAPNTYVIQRPAPAQNYPYITCVNCSRNSSAVPIEQSVPAIRRSQRPVDRGLIEELKKHNETKQAAPQPVTQPATPTVITTKKVVREKPVVRETVRVVDDPPRVIERRHVVVDPPALPPARPQARAAIADEVTGNVQSPADSKVRVIHAEAEVTILGPDRMSIRLFRKQGEPEAKAQPGE